jgi:hypothetical protein
MIFANKINFAAWPRLWRLGPRGPPSWNTYPIRRSCCQVSSPDHRNRLPSQTFSPGVFPLPQPTTSSRHDVTYILGWLVLCLPPSKDSSLGSNMDLGCRVRRMRALSSTRFNSIYEYLFLRSVPYSPCASTPKAQGLHYIKVATTYCLYAHHLSPGYKPSHNEAPLHEHFQGKICALLCEANPIAGEVSAFILKHPGSVSLHL